MPDMLSTLSHDRLGGEMELDGGRDAGVADLPGRVQQPGHDGVGHNLHTGGGDGLDLGRVVVVVGGERGNTSCKKRSNWTGRFLRLDIC